MGEKKEIRKHPFREGIFDFFREMFSVETWLKIRSTFKNIYHHKSRRSIHQIMGESKGSTVLKDRECGY